MRLLAVVLLLRERVDAAKRLLRRSSRSSVASSSSREPSAASSPASLEAAPRLRGLGVEPRELDLDLRDGRRRLLGLPPQLGLARSELLSPAASDAASAPPDSALSASGCSTRAVSRTVRASSSQRRSQRD